MEITMAEYLDLIGEKESLDREMITARIADEYFEIDNDYEGHLYNDCLTVDLIPNVWLGVLVDKLRMKKDYIPFFCENDEGKCNDDGWYDFHLYFYTDGKVKLTYSTSHPEECEGFCNEIELTESEQEIIYETVKGTIYHNLYYSIQRNQQGGFDIKDLDI